MTLTQRLTRAGATFIVFGIAAAFVPTNSNAFSATDTCAIPAQKDYVGSKDNISSYTLANNTLALTAYPANGVTATSVSSPGADYANTLSSSTVTTTRTAGSSASESVTVTFSDGHTVTYTVS